MKTPFLCRIILFLCFFTFNSFAQNAYISLNGEIVSDTLKPSPDSINSLAGNILYSGNGIVLYADEGPTYDEAQSDGACISNSGPSASRCESFTIPADSKYYQVLPNGWMFGTSSCFPPEWSWSLTNSKGQSLSEPWYVSPGETYTFCLTSTLSGTDCNIESLCLTPVAIEGEYELEHHLDDEGTKKLIHTLPDESILFSRDYFAVCADGSEVSKFRITGTPAMEGFDWRLRIKEDPNSSDTDKYGSFASSTNGGDYIEIAYTHPLSVTTPNDKSYVEYELEIVNSDDSDNLVEGFKFRVYKNPVVMVHGLWSDSKAFKKLDKLLEANGWEDFLLLRVNYKPTNANFFATNINHIPESIKEIKSKVVKEKIAVGKVDLVGHSMGGILSRLYLQSSAYKKDISRIITLNTPHSGSQLANLLMEGSDLSACLVRFFDRASSPTDQGAVNDLQVTSNAILMNLNGAGNLNNNKVPSHAIVSTANTAEFANDQDGSIARYAVTEWLLGSGDFTFNGCNLTDNTLNEAFNNETHDAIVALSSQKGGLSGSNISPFSNISHVGTPVNTNVLNKILALLKLPISHNSFTTSGFSPPTLTYTPSANINEVVLPNNSIIASTISITTPTEGQVFSPNEEININANGSSDITGIGILIEYSIDSLYSAKKSSSTATFDFTIDEVTGKRNIYAIGKNDAGETIIDSTFIYVCTDNLVINEDNIENGTFSATNISSSAAIEDQEIVNFEAGNSITLTAGFSAENGTSFSAIIKSCGTPSSLKERNMMENDFIENELNESSLVTNFMIYPNPITDVATIKITSSLEQNVKLGLYDINGRQIKNLANQLVNKGNHTITLQTTDLNAGFYYLTLKTEKELLTKKIVIQKN